VSVATLQSQQLQPDLIPNHHTIQAIITSLSQSQQDIYSERYTEQPRSELDSHANMIVLGSCSFIFESTGRTCTVLPFSSELGQADNVPIVDGAIAYDNPDTGQAYILLVRNALYIPTMLHNLLPPFILRAGGVCVRDVPKIHCESPTTQDHSISFKNHELTIPLRLHGTFSYFNHRMPLSDELHGCDKIFLSPDSTFWNPHCDSFAMNERSITNYDGSIMHNGHQKNYLMRPEHDSNDFSISSVHSSLWNNAIDICTDTCLTNIDLSSVSNNDSNINNEICDLADALTSQAEISKFKSTIGSCVINTKDDTLFTHSDESNIRDDDLDDFFSKPSSNFLISSTSALPSKGVQYNVLSKLWSISDAQAKAVINSTTQFNRQSADNSLSRNFSTNDRMLRYRRINSTFFTDTMFVTKKAKSTRGYLACQVFVSDKGFLAVYPMQKTANFEDALKLFCKEVGVPLTLVADPHPSQKSNSIRRFCDQTGMTLRLLEKSTQWANRAELYIGLLKESVRKDLRSSHAPMVLWDYCIQRRARIHNVTPRNLFQNDSLNPHTITFGDQADISNLCQFGWYEWVYYRDHGVFPINKEQLGRVLGPLKNEGNEMAQAVLSSTGRVIPRRTIRHLRPEELHNETEKAKRAKFDDLIASKLGDSTTFPNVPISDLDGNILEQEPSSTATVPPARNLPQQPMTDPLILSKVHLPQGESLQPATVLQRTTDESGVVQGTYNENPILNTLKYDVEFPNGEVKEYSANVITENMFSQVDPDGLATPVLSGILSFQKDATAVPKRDKYFISKSGRRHIKRTTDGYNFTVLYRDGSQRVVPLKELKESHPLEVAEFAVSQTIDDEPAFAWWVPYTLRKRDRIIAAVKARPRKITHKYGCEIPSTVREAYAIDKKNNNNLWRDAITKEMENLKVAFDILPHGQKAPVGYTKSSGHLVFEVRMTLERKARWVKDGHRTKNPENSTYAGVVSRESVRIALLYAALHDLPVCACDIQNAYLQAPSSERHYVICGPEFGLENIGKVAIIVRALYGGKSAGADYWRHVRQAMTSMKFAACSADPDVWMRKGIKPDGIHYWQFVLLYTDDILAIMVSPKQYITDELGTYFTVKPKSIGPPTQYLGNKVSNVSLDNGVTCWSFSSSQYVLNAVANVESHLSEKNEKLPSRSKSPWPVNYRPETDITPELNPTDAAYFQSLIGVLRWIVELGRGDICTEVSAMASMMAMPREGHLKALFQMFAFLKGKHNGVMVFDPTYPTIDESQFVHEDWSATPYGGSVEDLPPNMCEARGAGVIMRAFVDSDHASDTTNRRSRTGFIIFLNSAPIYWYSKKQTSVETSSFGSEFIAMKQCCEYIQGLRYKLRQMGIAINGPTYIFGDNQSVLVNSSKPHSQLKKKSSSIAYHFVREGVAKKEWIVAYLNTNLNPADMMTKSLPGGERRTLFTSYFLHYLN
jgi:hypothetical protein